MLCFFCASQLVGSFSQRFDEAAVVWSRFESNQALGYHTLNRHSSREADRFGKVTEKKVSHLSCSTKSGFLCLNTKILEWQRSVEWSRTKVVFVAFGKRIDLPLLQESKMRLHHQTPWNWCNRIADLPSPLTLAKQFCIS